GWYQQNFASNDQFDLCCDDATLLSRNEEQRFSLDYFWNLAAPTVLGISNLVTAGFAYEWQGFDQRTVITDTDFPFSSSNRDSRDNKAFYLQNQLDWQKRLFLTAGFRVDDNSTFGTEVTPRVSAAYVIPATETKIRGSYGEGIKEPTFIDNFGDGSAFSRGNVNLKPERSTSWEIGLDQSVLKGFADLSATYFHQRFEDLITAVFVVEPPSAFFRAENLRSASAEGVEVAARMRPGFGLTVSGTYTFLETKVLDDGGVQSVAVQEGQPLIRRPKHSGSLIIDHVWNRLHTNLTATFVGDRPDVFFDPVTFQSQRVTAKGYATVDLAASYPLLKDRLHLRELTLFGKILNLFDENYEQVFGFSAPGTTFLLGLKGSL
ncbi:MAG: TonB-dependent receptor, partial [Candidatus Methylomirabilis sp.]